MPGSMLATISLYGTFDGAGANLGPFGRTSTSVLLLVRCREEMFTTHFVLSLLLELRYSFARLLSFFVCLSLMCCGRKELVC